MLAEVYRPSMRRRKHSMLNELRSGIAALGNRWSTWREERAAQDAHAYRLPPRYRSRRDVRKAEPPTGYAEHEFARYSAIYILAEHVLAADRRQGVIDIGGDPVFLNALQAPNRCGLDIRRDADRLTGAFPGIRWIACDPETGLPSELAVDASDTVVICANVVERLRDPRRLLRDLARLADRGAIVILSTAERPRAAGDLGPPHDDTHVREWSLTEWQDFTRACGIPAIFAGTFSPTHDGTAPRTIVSIHDRRASRAMAAPARIERPLGITAVFNDLDIIEATVKSWLAHGCDVHLMDNWSTDGTYELLQSMRDANPERIALERFPSDGPTDQFNLYAILARKTEIISGLAGRWIVNLDSDQIRESLWPDIPLARALAIIEAAGYNAADFGLFHFRPTVDGFSRGDDPATFFDHFELDISVAWGTELRAWKQPDRPVEFASSGGHILRFEGLRIFPYRLMTRHYPLRSNAQAWRKVNQERLPRFVQEREKRGWHYHYDRHIAQTDFICDPAQLLRFDRHSKHDYLIEFVSDWNVRCTHPNWTALRGEVVNAEPPERGRGGR
jgi:SAM-dependent methyltransferase